jgi:LDH2 family malate/lactate/ureidoglycolate dehydrogenase
MIMLLNTNSGNVYSEEELKRFSIEIFEKAGLSHRDAHFFSDTLVQANLEGLDSHGISKLPIYYKRLSEGRINANPDIKISRTAPGIILVDGDNGPGPIVSKYALSAVMEIVSEIGIVAVGVKKSNHFGTASTYCKIACKQNLISIVCTNAPPGIAPWGSRKPYFGTNPIAFGFPNGLKDPIIIDMSSSVIARGKIRLAARTGEKIQEGWAMNKDGKITTDANEALEGSILPMGGPKGSALALAIEILSGLLTGASFGENVQHLYNDGHGEANVGHFFVLLDIKRYMNLGIYEHLLNGMISDIKNLPKGADFQEILIPGERRTREVNQRIKKGIYLNNSVLNELRTLSKTTNVSFLQIK